MEERLMSRWAGMCIEVYHQSLYNNTIQYFSKEIGLCPLHYLILNLAAVFGWVGIYVPPILHFTILDPGESELQNQTTMYTHLHLISLAIEPLLPSRKVVNIGTLMTKSSISVIGPNTRDHLQKNLFLSGIPSIKVDNNTHTHQIPNSPVPQDPKGTQHTAHSTSYITTPLGQTSHHPKLI